MNAFGADVRTLDVEAFLADPQSAVPGNGMPSSGIRDTAQRAELIAYLQTLK